MTGETGKPLMLHASCISHNGAGLLILGPSGAGKSALAIRLLALGAKLVSDDLTAVHADAQGLIARCPNEGLRGVIEARGIGLLRAPFVPEARLALAVDLGEAEVHRLPPDRRFTALGWRIPLVLRPQSDHLPESLLLYLAKGRHYGDRQDG